MNPHLKVEDLTYGGFGPVTFEISGGECVGFFGESGCGKTRLLRSIADLDPHNGSVLINDEDALSIAPSLWRRMVAFLPAESQWWFDKVADHFKTAPDKNDLASLGLSLSVLDSEVSHLSSGEKQRLSLLRTLSNSPSVLLLDEATAHLDSERAELTERKIVNLKDVDRLAVIWVSHNIDQLRRVCSRILYMAPGGRIIREEILS